MLTVSQQLSSSSSCTRCLAVVRRTTTGRRVVASSSSCSSSSSDSTFLPRPTAILATRLLSSSSHHSTNKSNLIAPGGTRARVRASVQQRRPVVRGEAVAFHVKDLEPREQPPHHLSTSTSTTTSKKSRDYDSDLVVLLDMDECLVHSQFQANADAAKVYAHQVQRTANGRILEGNGDEQQRRKVESFQFTLPPALSSSSNAAGGGDTVHTFLRPFVREFLQEVASKYETHIFTAAMPIYADPILNRLDPGNTLLAGRWYRDSCVYDETSVGRPAYVKNLKRILHNDGSNLRRTVLVDNNPLSFLANPANGILVSSFYNDPNDRTLPAVLELLHRLDGLEDVRPALEAQFGLEKALAWQMQQQEQRSNINDKSNHTLLQRIKKVPSPLSDESLVAI